MHYYEHKRAVYHIHTPTRRFGGQCAITSDFNCSTLVAEQYNHFLIHRAPHTVNTMPGHMEVLCKLSIAKKGSLNGLIS